MDKLITKFSLDVTKGGYQKILTGFVVGETLARRLEITLNYCGKPINLNDETVVMYSTPAGSETSVNSCRIENNTIIYDLVQGETSVVGQTIMQMKVISVIVDEEENEETRILYSPMFLLEVSASETDDSGAVESPTYTALEAALAAVGDVAENEEARIEAEAARVSAEEDRVSAESARVSAETDRATAETARASAETSRASAESTRDTNETARVSAESARDTAEASRASAETSRASAESSRESAETSRATAETARSSAETSRATAESGRVSAEASRVTAEEGRVSAESARVTAEEGRAAQFGTVLAEAQGYATSAGASATSASTDAASASASATSASTSATNASTSATSASTSATNASNSATSAGTSATSASASATLAESYAVGGTSTRTGEDTDNAKYYKEMAERVLAQISGVLIPMGTILFANLESQEKHTGYTYNISDAFTSTGTFKDGGGIMYPAGSDVYYTNDGYWDVLAGASVIGVKGDAETNYRIGQVNITKANIGLGNVDNTADSAKSVSHASTADSATNADTVNNHTVAADVPADAVFTDTTYSNATQSADGLMSKEDKVILDGLASGSVSSFNGRTGAVLPANGDYSYSQISNTPTLGTASALDVPTSGDASSTEVVKGDDSRLSDSRTPTAHNQAASTISAGTFAGDVVAPASTAYTTAHIANAVLTTSDPGSNASVNYPNGTIIFVYE